jgi:hypothetical protein
VLTALAVYVAVRVVRRRRKAGAGAREAGGGPGRAALREVAFGALFLVGVAAVYAIGALVPRPMAALTLSELDVLAVDVHSHTDSSHDGRRGWDPEHVRDWHRAAGYDVAYISDLERVTPARGPGTPGVRAIEIVDGAPRGLTQTRGDRSRIVRLADSLDLALVAGSNNHGWGRTAPGWTLLRIDNWRSAAPDQLAQAIETTLRGGRGATRVVERRVAEAGRNPLLLALTVPAVGWRMLTTLSGDQRVMWVVWAWALAAARVGLSRARRRREAGTDS